MSGDADLELGMLRDLQGWSIQVRFNQPGAEEVAFLQEDALRLDFEELRSAEADPIAYGRLLGKQLFADPEVAETFDEACAVAARGGARLRLRLLLPPSARELHDVRWETVHSADGQALAIDESIVLSRYLASSDWRRVPLQSREELRAVIAVANPRSDKTYGGKPVEAVEVAGELARAKECLGPIPTQTVLAAADGATGGATLPALTQALRDGCDILYLVCHGYVHDGEPQLLLENDAGEVHRVSGRILAEELGRVHRLPRLVVLVSCQSAGTGEIDPATADDGALAALGPRLARAGIPAVIAMQGNVSMATMATFLPIFFRELNKDGEIDKAMAIARHAVRDRLDWWMPVLFLRLVSGRVWYTPGFVHDDEYEQWPALIDHIDYGQCTPVLGIGLSDTLIGSRQDTARAWAKRYRYPLADHERDDLPQVAQYVATNQGDVHMRRELGKYLRDQLVERYPYLVPKNLGPGTLAQMLRTVWTARREQGIVDPFSVLAKLPFPMYVTTHTATLLQDALRAEGRWDDENPAVAYCEWNDQMRWPPSIYDREEDFVPTAERPLVVYLMGNMETPRPDNATSLVISESDYFNYVIEVCRTPEAIPEKVREALVNGALMFVGFRMQDWDFRVLFRTIMNQEGSERRKGYFHVAAQIDPEGGETVDPSRARRYLREYLKGDQVDVFWGTADDFTTRLWAEWQQAHPDA